MPRSGFHHVVHMRSRAMSVQMAHIFRRETTFGQRLTHSAHCALAARLGGSHMVSVTSRAKARDLGNNVGATCLSVLKRFQHQRTRSLACNETGTTSVERQSSLHGIIGLGDGTQVAKTSQRHISDALFSTTGKCRIGQAEANKAIGLAYAMSASRACRYNVQAIALQAIANGKITRRHVRDHGWNKQRAYALCSFFVQHDGFTLENFHATNTRSEHARKTSSVLLIHIDARLRHGFIRCQNGVLNEGGKATRFLLGKTRFQGIVVGNGSNNAHVELRSLFFRKKGKTALARCDLAPQCINTKACRRNRTHTRNYYAVESVVLLFVAHSDIPPSIAKTCPVM